MFAGFCCLPANVSQRVVGKICPPLSNPSLSSHSFSRNFRPCEFVSQCPVLYCPVLQFQQSHHAQQHHEIANTGCTFARNFNQSIKESSIYCTTNKEPKLAATLRWFTAGGAIRITLRQLSQTWKLRHYDVIDDVIIWVQDGNCKKNGLREF